VLQLVRDIPCHSCDAVNEDVDGGAKPRHDDDTRVVLNSTHLLRGRLLVSVMITVSVWRRFGMCGDDRL